MREEADSMLPSSAGMLPQLGCWPCLGGGCAPAEGLSRAWAWTTEAIPAAASAAWIKGTPASASTASTPPLLVGVRAVVRPATGEGRSRATGAPMLCACSIGLLGICMGLPTWGIWEHDAKGLAPPMLPMQGGEGGSSPPPDRVCRLLTCAVVCGAAAGKP